MGEAAELSQYIKGEEPRGMAGSDPESVREIVELEGRCYDMFNDEFLQDANALMDFYADSPDIVMYDLFAPGEYRGDEVGKYVDWVGARYVGVFECHDLRVWAKADCGFAIMTQRYEATGPDGNSFDWRLRQTDCLLKGDGEWKIYHTHYSWPVRKDFTGELVGTELPFPWESGGHL